MSGRTQNLYDERPSGSFLSASTLVDRGTDVLEKPALDINDVLVTVYRLFTAMVPDPPAIIVLI
jgi:hypothetical protein